MDSLLNIFAIAAVAVHALLLVFTLLRWSNNPGLHWLMATIMLSLIAIAAYLLPEDIMIAGKSARGLVLIVVLIGMLETFGELVLQDISHRRTFDNFRRLWRGVNGLWLLIFMLAALIGETASIGQPGWLIDGFDASGVSALSGLVISGLILLGVAFYDFYDALMPEIANRAVYWVLTAAVVLMGMALISSGIQALAMLGMMTLTSGMIGALYARFSYRVFDIRDSITLGLRTLSLTAITMVVIFVTLYTVNGLELNTDAEGTLVLAALSLVIAALYVPVRQLVEIIFQRIAIGQQPAATLMTREYSQNISAAGNLDELIQIATRTLNRVMRVRRSALILVNSAVGVKNSVELLVMHAGSAADRHKTKEYISQNSPVYELLVVKQKPITQFDLDFDPKYKDVPQHERDFFRGLHMSAYAPIFVEHNFTGLLACGPKVNDTAVNQRDLELLLTLAQQLSIALRNARLIDDLQHLNTSMRSLNTGLRGAKDELEKLDSIKSDFVTIASHELRTPLAQIRGYTDIVDALNEQGMLDKDQTNGLVINLRKATERVEELIAAMLDVSQLDVNAMDLRFAQTTAESVLRMAIEPLTDAIKQRKLTLSARGLRGLPHIQADLQRLVQAFRNIIVNSIKFTSDGGRIDIRAVLQEAASPGDNDNILIQIQDTGVGIKQSDLELIFKKFYRGYNPSLHSTGTYKFLGAGPGLGLTIAKGVIEGHGGKIWAESPGHDTENMPGATFYILLPVSPPEDARRVMPFEVTDEKERVTKPRKPEGRKLEQSQ